MMSDCFVTCLQVKAKYKAQAEHFRRKLQTTQQANVQLMVEVEELRDVLRRTSAAQQPPYSPLSIEDVTALNQNGGSQQSEHSGASLMSSAEATMTMA